MKANLPVKERPIIFSAPMVRAILDGHKTQTRRPLKYTFKHGGIYHLCVLKNANLTPLDCENGLMWRPYAGSGLQPMPPEKLAEYCPYGSPGDRLWVREAFYDDLCLREANDHDRAAIYYRADPLPDFEGQERRISWSPSIHMPRWASRITLEIVGVRVQRLQQISEGDATAEGMSRINPSVKHRAQLFDPETKIWRSQTNKETFEAFWDQLNENKYPWQSDPWVWVIEFKRVES